MKIFTDILEDSDEFRCYVIENRIIKLVSSRSRSFMKLHMSQWAKNGGRKMNREQQQIFLNNINLPRRQLCGMVDETYATGIGASLPEILTKRLL